MKTCHIFDEDIEYLARLSLWKKLSGKTLMITGATGMLGSYLAFAANKANLIGGYGIRLVLSGRNSQKAKQLFDNIECRILLQDIREPLDVDGPLHYIIHTAGPVGPAVFEKNPLEVISVNVEGTMSLLRSAIQHDCLGVVFASTHEVYGKAEGEQKESSILGAVDPYDPRSSYILAKQTAENILACFSSTYGLKSASARLSRLYGPLMNMDSGLFICSFINDALHNMPVHVRGELNQLRPLCYIADAAEAMLRILLNADRGEAYNVQGKELPTIGDIALMVSEIGNCGVKFDKPETGNKPATGYWLNTDRIERLDWWQRTGLLEGLRRTMNFFAGSETENEEKEKDQRN